jgi:hypothetical protein
MGRWAPAAPTSCSLTPSVSMLSLCRKSQSPLHPGRTLPHLQPAVVVALQPPTAASDRRTGQLSPSCYTCCSSLSSDYTACPLSLVLGELQSPSKACHLWWPPSYQSWAMVLALLARAFGRPLGLRKAHLPQARYPSAQNHACTDPWRLESQRCLAVRTEGRYPKVLLSGWKRSLPQKARAEQLHGSGDSPPLSLSCSQWKRCVLTHFGAGTVGKRSDHSHQSSAPSLSPSHP